MAPLKGLALTSQVQRVGLRERRGGYVQQHADVVDACAARGPQAVAAVAGYVVRQVWVPEDVVTRLERGEGDEASPEVQMRVPSLREALRVAGHGAVDNGVWIALKLPVGGIEVDLPLGPGARGGSGKPGAEEGPEQVVGGGELGRRQQPQHAGLYRRQGEEALEHAEDCAGGVAVVQVRGGVDAAGALPGVVVSQRPWKMRS